jgi:hypothetical protein
MTKVHTGMDLAGSGPGRELRAPGVEKGRSTSRALMFPCP